MSARSRARQGAERARRAGWHVGGDKTTHAVMQMLGAVRFAGRCK
jgi:hypothetical protein